jgi:outer membrane cobalamin receptor
VLISSRPILLRLLALSAIATRAAADDVRSLPEVEVSASRYSLIGVADSASEGVAGQFQIGNRVVARAGELLEVVPGLIVSQHSGDGKANQYFLRGFNLDHGIDFKMSLDGMPINQRSHAHGQGWADLNPLIPELISSIHYRKGPYTRQMVILRTQALPIFTTLTKLIAALPASAWGKTAFIEPCCRMHQNSKMGTCSMP